MRICRPSALLLPLAIVGSNLVSLLILFSRIQFWLFFALLCVRGCFNNFNFLLSQVQHIVYNLLRLKSSLKSKFQARRAARAGRAIIARDPGGPDLGAEISAMIDRESDSRSSAASPIIAH